MGVNGIYGLSGSGLDIESLVKVGMMSKQNEYDKMAQKYTKNEWTKTAFVELNSQITTFNMTKLYDYKLTSTMKAKTAESSDETAVTATANGNAVAMPHRVDVDQLSTNAYLISGKTIKEINESNNKDPNSLKLSDILFKDFGKQSLYVDSGVSYTSNSIKTTKTEEYKLPDAEDAANVEIKTVTNSTDSKKTTTIKLSDTETITVETEGDKTTYTMGDKSMILTKQNGSTAVQFSGISTPATMQVTVDGNRVAMKFTNSEAAAKGFPTITLKGNTISLDKQDGSSVSLTNENGSITSVTKKADDSSEAVTYDKTKLTKTTEVQEISFGENNAQTITLETVTDANNEKPRTTATYNDGTTKHDGKVQESGKVYTAINSTFEAKKSLDAGKMFFTFGEDSNAQGITLSKDKNGTVTAKLSETVRHGLIGVASDETQISKGFDNLTGFEGKNVQESDTAIEFTIGDGHKTSEPIKVTFGELLNEIDGKAFTINDLVNRINDAAKKEDLNVRATYESLSGRFFLYNSESGAEEKIEITAGNAKVGTTEYNTGYLAKTFFNSLGLMQSEDGTLKGVNSENDPATISGAGGSISVAGSYGIARVDGVIYDKIENNQLKIDALGVTYDLHKTTTEYATDPITGNKTKTKIADNPVTVGVSQDTEAIVNKVKSFIEDYNKLLGSLYEKYDEKADSNYKPLTQSQKDGMKEEQITKWEEKAKQGLLYHDSTLSKIISDMREAITRSVELDDGSKVSIFSLGVSTTGIKGQLTLDEDKLKKALGEDPDIVYNVFGTLGDSDAKGISDQNGVAQRLGDIFTNATKLIKSRAGSSADIAEDSDLNNLLRELQTKMSNFKKLMSAFEDRLYKKYDAMEVALTKLGTQLSFITGGQ